MVLVLFLEVKLNDPSSGVEVFNVKTKQRGLCKGDQMLMRDEDCLGGWVGGFLSVGVTRPTIPPISFM